MTGGSAGLRHVARGAATGRLGVEHVVSYASDADLCSIDAFMEDAAEVMHETKVLMSAGAALHVAAACRPEAQKRCRAGWSTDSLFHGRTCKNFRFVGASMLRSWKHMPFNIILIISFLFFVPPVRPATNFSKCCADL